MSTTHKIEIQQTGDQFVATVPAIGAVVTGEIEEAALREAERAIVARMIEEAEKRKRRRRGKGASLSWFNQVFEPCMLCRERVQRLCQPLPFLGMQ